MRDMMKVSNVQHIDFENDNIDDDFNKNTLPDGIEVFEINGPLFFGAAFKFKDAMKIVGNPAKVLIIRMKNVPIIDATGIHIINQVYKEALENKTRIILSEIKSEQVLTELKKARLIFKIGKANITETYENALIRGTAMING